MGLILTNCLKGLQDDLQISTPYRKPSGRKAQIQNLLSNKSNPDVDGRKLSQPPPLAQEPSWGRPSTPQGGTEDSPGSQTPGSASSFATTGYFNSQNNFGMPQSTNTGSPNAKDRPRKVSFNFHHNSSKNERDKNYM